jgi:hypothetical protein
VLPKLLLLVSAKLPSPIYAQNYGDDFSDYIEFASENYGDGSLADTNNNNLGNTPAEIQRNQKLVNNNNLQVSLKYCCLCLDCKHCNQWAYHSYLASS